VNDYKNDNTALGFSCSNMEFLDYDDITNVEFVFVENWYSRRVHPTKVTKVDDNTVFLTMRNWERVNANESGMPGSVYYYENAYELLDEEGEFFVDKAEDQDIVYYKPRQGEDIRTAVITSPQLETVITIGGKSVISPAQNITLSGIEIKDATWLSPNANDFLDQQNLYPEMPAAALYLKNANHITVERCTVKNCGGDALAAARTVQDSSFIGNHIYDISARGMHIGDWNGPEDSNNPLEIASGFTIENNYIHAVGEEYYASTGLSCVWIADSVIRHNEIGDVPYSGMHIGWGWADYSKTSLKNLLVENNYVHDTMHTCIDGGAIYFLGANRATEEEELIVRGNYFKNSGMGTMGVVYCDTGAVHVRFSENVMDNHESVWNGNYGITGPGNNFNDNYTTTDIFRSSGSSVTPVNTMVYPSANWPDEALSIINHAGLEEAYQDILEGSAAQYKLKNNYSLSGVSSLMRANENHAFVKTSETQISVFDVSDAENVSVAKVIEKEIENSGGQKYTVKAMELNENCLLVQFANGADNRIAVYDVSNPAIEQIQELNATGSLTMLANNQYVMVPYANTLALYALSALGTENFGTPVTLSFACEEEMYLDDGYLYVVRNDDEIIEIYAVNGTALTKKGTCPITDAGVRDLVRKGDSLYVATKLPMGDRSGVFVYDLSSLNDGGSVTQLTGSAPINNREVIEKISLDKTVTEVRNENYIFKIRSSGSTYPATYIDVYDAENPASLITSIRYHMEYDATQVKYPYYSFGSLYVKGDRLVATTKRTAGSGNPRVVVFDVSALSKTTDAEGTALTPIGIIGIYNKDNGILFANDDYVFLNDVTLKTLYVCTLNSNEAPILRLAALFTDSNNMYADNDYLYVHDEAEGKIDIYTLSAISGGSFGPVHKVASIEDDMDHLEEAALASQHPAKSISLSGDYLFSANEGLGMVSVSDISRPLDIKALPSLTLYDADAITGVYAYGNRVYVLEEGKRLLIYERNGN
ncbi:MAG: right-handed parallel beta-helix repeat-containing protein, partial [Clostridia bacterium]|nr:right-handed parallel beta-helix repeat-containing protein [Clostridia bacterium]